MAATTNHALGSATTSNADFISNKMAERNDKSPDDRTHSLTSSESPNQEWLRHCSNADTNLQRQGSLDRLASASIAILKDRRASTLIEMDKRLEQLRLTGQNRHTMSHVEDRLCNMFRVDTSSNIEPNRVNITKFLEAISSTGLRHTDPRLREMRLAITNIQSTYARDTRFWTADGLCVEENIFKGIIMENIDVINRALTGDFIIPLFGDFCQQIEEIFFNVGKDQSGKVATYIPQLARCEPSLWGVSVCSIDGQRFSVGDVAVPFTLQSTSKPISYCVACAENDCDYVHRFVGQEPSGRSFNELVLDNESKPHNPMVNSGAIMTTSLIKPNLCTADRFDHVFQIYRKLTGGEYLGFNNAVYLSERQAADRNYALAYFMREHRCFPNNTHIDEVLDFYFMMCSLEATCESAAIIAATLANGGVCPVTGQSVICPAAVRNTLCLMHSCGMYDYSGQFAFKCGVPAKSGVSGVILLVIPSVMGLALYSPPLDNCGNSVRGVAFCKELVKVFNFHHFDNETMGGSKVDPRKAQSEKQADTIHRLLFAAAAGDLSAIKRYSLIGIDLNSSDYDGRTALHLAAAEGHHRIVHFLLIKCNVVVDPQDRWGHTPLEEARSNGHASIVQQLVRHYIKSGKTPPAGFEPIEIKLNNLGTDDRTVSTDSESEVDRKLSTSVKFRAAVISKLSK